MRVGSTVIVQQHDTIGADAGINRAFS